MDLLVYSFVAIVFGAYSTYLLATSLPEEVFDAAANDGRFAYVGGDTSFGPGEDILKKGLVAAQA
jgi:hypothetical protein